MNSNSKPPKKCSCSVNQLLRELKIVDNIQGLIEKSNALELRHIQLRLEIEDVAT